MLWPEVVMRVLILVSVVVLGGCATLSRDQCLESDWQAIGRADALVGYQTSRLEEHRQACFDYGVQPDFEAYKQGHAQGLVNYCTFKGGFKAGYGGYRYYQLCPATVEADFLDGYEMGRDIYRRQEHFELLYESRFHRGHHGFHGLHFGGHH